MIEHSRTAILPTLTTLLEPLRVTTLSVLPGFLLGGLAVQVRASLDLSLAGIGSGVSFFFALSALAAAPAGRLVERAGAHRGLQSASVLSAISLMGMGASTEYLFLLAFVGVGGIANAVAQVSSNLYIARLIPLDRQGFAFGVKQAAIPAGTLLGGLAVPAIGLTVGWRWAFRIGATIAILQMPFIRKALQDVARNAKRTQPVSRMRLSSLVILSSAAAFGAMAANALGAFFVDSAVTLGVEEGHAGLLFAAGSTAGVIVRVWAGWMADRREPSTQLVAISSLLFLGALGYLLLAVGMSSLLLLAALVCFGAGWGWPGLFYFTVVDRNRSAPALASGIALAGGFIGGILGPFIFGVTAGATSYGVAWGLSSVWAGVAGAAILVSRRRVTTFLSKG